MTSGHEDLRTELRAAMQARQELPDHEDYLAEQFLNRLERDFYARLAVHGTLQPPRRREVRGAGCLRTMSQASILLIPIPVSIIVGLALGPEHFAAGVLIGLSFVLTTMVVTAQVTWRVAQRVFEGDDTDR